MARPLFREAEDGPRAVDGATTTGTFVSSSALPGRPRNVPGRLWGASGGVGRTPARAVAVPVAVAGLLLGATNPESPIVSGCQFESRHDGDVQGKASRGRGSTYRTGGSSRVEAMRELEPQGR